MYEKKGNGHPPPYVKIEELAVASGGGMSYVPDDPSPSPTPIDLGWQNKPTTTPPGFRQYANASHIDNTKNTNPFWQKIQAFCRNYVYGEAAEKKTVPFADAHVRTLPPISGPLRTAPITAVAGRRDNGYHWTWDICNGLGFNELNNDRGGIPLPPWWANNDT